MMHLYVFAFLLAMPVLLPIAMISHSLDQRDMRAVSESQPCPACGARLGVAALRASDEQWQAYVDELRRANPGAFFRLVRRHHAICTVCGAHSMFDRESGAFTLIELGG